jgi:hypothetical protein
MIIEEIQMPFDNLLDPEAPIENILDPGHTLFMNGYHYSRQRRLETKSYFRS